MEMRYVDDFKLDNSDEDEECEPRPKRRRAANRVWIKDKEFKSADEAEKFVRAQNLWSKSSSKHTSSGHRIDYRCSGGKLRAEECPAARYLLFHSDSDAVSLFKTEADHANHDTNPSRGLPVDLKTFVKKKFEEGIPKPNAILEAIRQAELVEPTKEKLVTYLQKVRTEKYGQPTIFAKDVIAWCKARTAVPLCEDEPFVLRYNIQADSVKLEDQQLQIVISTPHLLGFLTKSELVQSDTIYKLLWQGYPVILVGTSDKNQTFHPFALAICKNESAADFEFIFECLLNYNTEWKPRILLADDSEAITAGFRSIFGVPEVRAMCFVHVIQNLEKCFKGLSKNSEYKNLRRDIHHLQTCPNQATFTKASTLFLNKWNTSANPKIRECVTYFHLNWLQKNCCWYEGAAPGFPSTNHGIQTINSVIKREHTLRERLPVGQFFNHVVDLLRKWSNIRHPTCINCVHFAEEPTISLQQWTDAYQWAAASHKVITREENGTQVYYTHSTKLNEPITVNIVQEYDDKEGQWEDFDEFVQLKNTVWKISMTVGCSCPVYSRFYTCKHFLGMKIRLKLAEAPLEAKLIRLGQKTKRGRPALAKQALIIQ